MELGINEVRRLTASIKSKFGFDLNDYALTSLRRRLASLADYSKVSSSDELIRIIEENNLTFEQFGLGFGVAVTELFRDPAFWRKLDDIIKRIAQQNSRIQVWIPKCSSGEEVFSFIILCKEAGILDKVNVITTDIHSSIWDCALKNKTHYKKHEISVDNYKRFKKIDTETLDKYFTKNGDYYTFSPALLNNCRFNVLSLSQNTNYGNELYDLILCRNSLLYFNKTLSDKVLDGLYTVLKPNGLLALGIGEQIKNSSVATKFFTVDQDDKIFKKVK